MLSQMKSNIVYLYLPAPPYTAAGHASVCLAAATVATRPASSAPIATPVWAASKGDRSKLQLFQREPLMLCKRYQLTMYT